MVNYTCIRCNYNTQKKCDILKHYNRKIICKPMNEEVAKITYKKLLNEINGKKTYECIFCNVIYSYSSGLSRHKRTCTKNTNIINNSKIKNSNNTIKNITNNITNNTNNNTNNITNNININIFGEVNNNDSKYINDEKLLNLLKDEDINYIIAYLRTKFLDNAIPENQCIRMSDKGKLQIYSYLTTIDDTKNYNWKEDSMDIKDLACHVVIKANKYGNKLVLEKEELCKEILTSDQFINFLDYLKKIANIYDSYSSINFYKSDFGKYILEIITKSIIEFSNNL